MYRLVSTQAGDLAADLDRPRLSIGRDPSNDLVLADDGVSGFHASIFFDNGRTVIVDQGSINGTFVNGQAIEGRQELKAWDRIRFASVEFEVVDPVQRKPTMVQAAVSAASPVETKPAPDGPVLGTMILTAGSGCFERFEIRGKSSVGRNSDNTLHLDMPTVSSRHADIIPAGATLEVVDLGSTNGTYVNGNRITRCKLAHGDRVRFDDIEFRLELPAGEVAKTQLNPAVKATGVATQVNPAVGVASPASSISPLPSTSPVQQPASSRPTEVEVAATQVDMAAPRKMTANINQQAKVSAPVSTPSPASAPLPVSELPKSSPIQPPPASSRPTEVAAAATRVDMAPPKMTPPPQMTPPPKVASPRPQAVASQETSTIDSSGQGWQWLLFAFHGRIGRQTYFFSALGLGLTSFTLISLIQMLFYGQISFDPYFPGYFPSILAVNLLAFWPGLALMVKRMHDQNRSGHWLWLLFLPLISIVPAVMLLFVPGTKETNRFGQEPK